MTTGAREVQYLVLPDTTRPNLLARVRWPDVYQAISPVRPDWQNDIGLFDLPYDPNSTSVSRELAARIAEEWGARLPSDEVSLTPEVSLMRRMPADWSNLSRAEKRSWSIEFLSPKDSVAKSGSTKTRWRRRRRVDLIDLTDTSSADVIDLTATEANGKAKVDDA